jgi:alkylation response protein AidB-like acyl-CoA dehydrogenase
LVVCQWLPARYLAWRHRFAGGQHRPAHPGDDGKPDRWRLLFPASQARLVDIWDVSGLRGTASDAIEVDDLFVPRGFAYGCDAVGHPRPQPRYESGKLYAFPSIYPIGFASVAVGVARSTLDAFVELAAAKTPRGGRNVLNQSAVIQAQFARADASLRSARLFLRHSVKAAWKAAAPDQLIDIKHRARIRLASTHAIHTAAEVVDVAYRAAGATAIFTNQPFERRFRDIHALTQQVQGSQAHFEAVGQFLLGLPPDLTWM